MKFIGWGKLTFWTYTIFSPVTSSCTQNYKTVPLCMSALPTKGKDMVFRFIIEYSSLRDFGP